jgi:uncharacterized protein YcsI (UPF0317 family)
MDDGVGTAATRSAQAARARIRRGEHRGHTARLARGKVQGNIAILPAEWADDFVRFCLIGIADLARPISAIPSPSARTSSHSFGDVA